MLMTVGSATVGLLLVAGGFALSVLAWIVGRVALGSSRMLHGWRKWVGIVADVVFVAGALFVAVLAMMLGVLVVMGAVHV